MLQFSYSWEREREREREGERERDLLAKDLLNLKLSHTLTRRRLS